MGTALIAIGILIAAAVLMHLFSKEQKVPASCRKCTEFKYCGGGKPRCPRRSERKQ